MTNPVLQEIQNLSPAAQEALQQAHQASSVQATVPNEPMASAPAMPALVTPPKKSVPPIGAAPATSSPSVPEVGNMSSLQKMPSLVPSPAPVALSPSPKGTLFGDEEERGRLLSSGSGIHQIKNPLLRGLAGVGNAIGTLAAPGLMRVIPGTEEHHNLLLGQNARDIGTDLGIANKQATNAELNARAPLEVAQTENLQHPNLQITPTSRGEEIFNPKEGSLTPVVQNGTPVMPYTKPGPRQHVFLKGPGDQAVAATFDPQSGNYYDAHDNPIQNPQPYEKPTAIQAKTLQLPDGKQVAGKVDSKGNLLLEDGTPAPAGTKLYQQPNYGMMVLPTKTATFIDPKTNLPVEMQWDEKTQTYDKPLGLSASNAYGHEAAQAGAVDRAGNDLIKEIQAHRNKLGNPESIIQSAILGTPWADPATAGLRSQIATFAALQPSMHGFRGQDAMRQFEKILGGIPNNPDAMIASIQGIEKTAGAINPGLGGNDQNAKQTPDSHVFNLSAWKKANPKGDANAAKAYAIQQGYKVVE